MRPGDLGIALWVLMVVGAIGPGRSAVAEELSVDLQVISRVVLVDRHDAVERLQKSVFRSFPVFRSVVVKSESGISALKSSRNAVEIC